MSVYHKHCLEYLKKGLSVTPDYGKRPAIKNWTKYCKFLPTKEEVEGWLEQLGNCNIAVCCGPASGIIALDFDEEDPEVISKIVKLLPESPVERIGKKGFVRFFAYNGEKTQDLYRYGINSEGKKIKIVTLEILSDKKKATIPPSIHPDTQKQYTWTGKSLLDVISIDENGNKIIDLPKLPTNLIENLQKVLKEFKATTLEGGKSGSQGRHYTLGSYVAKIIGNPKHTVAQAITDLIKYDKEQHDKPLFFDPEENIYKDARLNALDFYYSYLKSINLKRQDEGKRAELPIINLSKLASKPSELQKDTSQPVLPEGLGLVKDITDLIAQRSFIEQPAFALSAALTCISTISDRNFEFNGVAPNLYMLNIGESGTGKTAGQETIKDIYHRLRLSNRLLGASKYASESAVIKSLSVFPNRHDIIDEASTFLSDATKGQGYLQGIGDTLCELYSSSTSTYTGKTLAGSDEKLGACYRPHLNLLCSTTPRGLQEAISMSALEKGLFGRFVIMFGDNYKKGKRNNRKPNPSNQLLQELMAIYSWKNPNAKTGNLVSQNKDAYPIKSTREADTKLDAIFEEFDNKRVTLTQEDKQLRPIIARLYEQMLKFVMISAIGQSRGSEPVVRIEDVEFGYSLIKYFFFHISSFVKGNLFETQRGNKASKISRIIKDGGKQGVLNSTLCSLTQDIYTREREDILNDLQTAKKVRFEIIMDGDSKYIWIAD